MIWIRRSSLAVCLLLASCATPAPVVSYRPVLLPLPEAPVLTPVKAEQLQCLSDATYSTVVNREAKLRRYGQQLRAILEANNAGVFHGQ